MKIKRFVIKNADDERNKKSFNSNKEKINLSMYYFNLN